MRDIASWLKSKPWFNQVGYFLIDPSAFIEDQSSRYSFAHALHDLGIPVEKASKARTECIKLTNEAFYNKERKVWIHENLKMTRKEIASWYYGKENKPVDANDHLMECMGRLVMHDNLTYRQPPKLSLESTNYSIDTLDDLNLGIQEEFLNFNLQI